MERHYFGLSTLLASVALLIWSIGETFAFPQGPNVSLGSNPVVSFVCSNAISHPVYSNSYVVPVGFDLIITDIAYGYGGSTSLKVDGSAVYSGYSDNLNPGPGYPDLRTGLKVESGKTVSCNSARYGFVSGYLVHQ